MRKLREIKMEHLAIMKKSWNLTNKILTREKTVESRWYKNQYPPWNKIKTGETIYFKDSGNPVTIKAKVTKVLQFDNLNSDKNNEIISKWGKEDLGVNEIPQQIQEYIKNKNYCILVFFDNVEKIKPFKIRKKGFGMMSSWLCIDNIRRIKDE